MSAESASECGVRTRATAGDALCAQVCGGVCVGTCSGVPLKESKASAE